MPFIHLSFHFRAMLVFVASPSLQKVWNAPWRWAVTVGGRGPRKDPTTRMWARKRRKSGDQRKAWKKRRKRLKVQRLVQRPAGQVGTRKVSSTWWMSQHDWLSILWITPHFGCGSALKTDRTAAPIWVCRKSRISTLCISMVRFTGKFQLKMRTVSSCTGPHVVSNPYGWWRDTPWQCRVL